MIRLQVWRAFFNCVGLGKQLHEEWRALQQRVGADTSLYWAVGDIEDAYGSVLLPHLYQILQEFHRNLSPPESGRWRSGDYILKQKKFIRIRIFNPKMFEKFICVQKLQN
jgi:hypothetical protein